MMLKKAAILGHPVRHSLSPMIHDYWIKAHGLSGTYETIDVLPEDLVSSVRKIFDDGYTGFNVTLPHKEAVMDCCDVVDDTARLIGAVNTLSLSQGRIVGSNTDAKGFIANLREQYPGWDPSAGAALVLGAGGAARAVIYGLQQAGVKDIILCNRTRARAEKITDSFVNLTIMDWEDRNNAAQAASLIVNTTSLGMAGKDHLVLDLPSGPGCVAYDIVYRPLMTEFLVQAQQKGLPFVTGLGMLLHQARFSFEAWFGILPDIDTVLRDQVTKAAQEQ